MPREFPRSGSTLKDLKERKRKKKRLKVDNNNGQLCIVKLPDPG